MKHLPCLFSENQEYKVWVDQGQTEIIQNLKNLKTVFAKASNHTEEVDTDASGGFTAFSFIRHLYQPLLYIKDKVYKDLVKISPVALNDGEQQFVGDLKSHYESKPDFFDKHQLFLLRNRSKKGVGFFEANNFYPDFILWLVTGKHQYIAFIDPKGLRNIDGFSNKKIQFYKTIKDETEKRLDDADVSLSSFIISNTPYNQLNHWKGQEKIQDFNKHNVYFQKEQQLTYVEELLGKVLI